MDDNQEMYYYYYNISHDAHNLRSFRVQPALELVSTTDDGTIDNDHRDAPNEWLTKMMIMAGETTI